MATAGGTALTSTFDPHELDWSVHRLDPRHREYGPGPLLADVVPLLGAALMEAWHGRETADMTLPAPLVLDVPPPHEAFDRGESVADVHRESGRSVRQALRKDDDVIAGTTVLVPGPRAVDHEDGPTADLSEAEWEDAYWLVVAQREMRRWAREAMEHVATAIADMALAGAITPLARPLLGGPTREVEPDLWHTGPEIRMRRLAASGISLAAPFDAAAAADHLLFLEPTGLTEAVEAYGAANLVPPIPDDHPWWNEARPASRSRTPASDELIRRELKRVLLMPENRHWRMPQVQAHILAKRERGFGDGLRGVVERICEELKAETRGGGPQYASLGLSGRPRCGDELVRKR